MRVLGVEPKIPQSRDPQSTHKSDKRIWHTDAPLSFADFKSNLPIDTQGIFERSADHIGVALLR